jgi:hypothetical protein
VHCVKSMVRLDVATAELRVAEAGVVHGELGMLRRLDGKLDAELRRLDTEFRQLDGEVLRWEWRQASGGKVFPPILGGRESRQFDCTRGSLAPGSYKIWKDPGPNFFSYSPNYYSRRGKNYVEFGSYIIT